MRWLALVLVVGLAGCGREEDSDPALSADCGGAVSLDVWLSPPPAAPVDADGLPVLVGGSTDCAFNRFAWQDFLALTRPRASGVALFDTWPDKWTLHGDDAVVNRSGLPEGALIETVEAGPTPNPLVDVDGEWTYYRQRVNAVAAAFLDGCGLMRPECLAAVTLPLGTPGEADPPYPVRFADGSVVLKEAWRVMGSSDDRRRFLTRTATLSPARAGTVARAEATVGLVGLHVVHLTADQRAWVWATFEHVDNAPDCDRLGEAASRPVRYSYFAPDCASRCARRQREGQVSARVECSAVCGELNVYHNNGCPLDTEPSQGVLAGLVEPGQPTISRFRCGPDLAGECWTSESCFHAGLDVDRYGGYYGGPNCYLADAESGGAEVARQRAGVAGCSSSLPTQVCRAWPVGFRGITTAADGTQRTLLDPTLEPQNAAIRRSLAARGGELAVLSNYRLVGVQWGEPKTGGRDPIWSGDIIVRGDPSLLNVTMEAYIQGRGLAADGSRFDGGCLGCHGTASPQFGWDSFKGVDFRPWRQLHFSHLVDYVGDPRGAGDPAACADAVAEARAALQPGQGWKQAILAGCPITPRADR